MTTKGTRNRGKSKYGQNKNNDKVTQRTNSSVFLHTSELVQIDL